MRFAALLAAALSLSSSAALADPAGDQELDTARTVDLAGGPGASAARGPATPGCAASG